MNTVYDVFRLLSTSLCHGPVPPLSLPHQSTALQPRHSARPEPACVALARHHRGSSCLCVLLCFVCGSRPVPCCCRRCVRGQSPLPLSAAIWKSAATTEISLSSRCSLTFSGAQLALNAEIIIIPITQADSVSSLCGGG